MEENKYIPSYRIQTNKCLRKYCHLAAIIIKINMARVTDEQKPGGKGLLKNRIFTQSQCISLPNTYYSKRESS